MMYLGDTQEEIGKMRTSEQINTRIAELNSKLVEARRQATMAQTGDFREMAEMKIYRLEGNIGSLEWALREE